MLEKFFLVVLVHGVPGQKNDFGHFQSKFYALSHEGGMLEENYLRRFTKDAAA